MIYGLEPLYGAYAWSRAWDWQLAGTIAQFVAIMAFGVTFVSGGTLFYHSTPDHFVALQITGLVLGVIISIACPLFIRHVNRAIRRTMAADATDPRRFPH